MNCVVRRGDFLGAVGSSGRVTAPHLHYEVRVGGAPVNPYFYLAKAAVYQSVPDARVSGRLQCDRLIRWVEYSGLAVLFLAYDSAARDFWLCAGATYSPDSGFQ